MRLRSEIRRFVIENFLYGDGEVHFGDEDSLLELGLIDSTGVLELVAFVEETYAIDVADEELLPENFDSVSSLAAYVGRKQAAPEGAWTGMSS